MFGKGHGGLYKAPAEEKSRSLRGEGDQIKYVLGFGKERRRQEVSPMYLFPMMCRRHATAIHRGSSNRKELQRFDPSFIWTIF